MLKILTQVNVTRRQCEIVRLIIDLNYLFWETKPFRGIRSCIFFPFFLVKKLEATDFDEKKEINKRKQMILEGKVSIYLKWTDNSHFNA